MCFSLAGRLQTRMVALLAPALLAAVLILFAGDQRYFTMFMVMALVAVDLDVIVYSRSFRYQARWHTYLLGLVEFFLTLALVRWLAGTLPLHDIVLFYVISWLSGYVLVHAVLPVVDPLWSEHGGEIGRRGATWEAEPAPACDRRAAAREYLAKPRATTLSLLVLLSLTLLTQTVLPGTVSVAQVAAALAGALVAGWIGTRLSPGARLSIEERVTLGLLVGLLLRGPDIWPFAVAGAVAAACRTYLLIRGQPVFNAAACAFLVAVLVVPGSYSAEGQWGNSLLLPLALANVALLIALRSRYLPLVSSFGVVVLGHGLLLALGRHESLPVLLPQLTPTSLIFFAGFVLPDPSTTPRPRPAQIALGTGVALLGTLLKAVGIGLPFVIALLALNYVTVLVLACIRALPPRFAGARARVLPRAESNPAAAGLTRRAFLRSIGAAATGTLLLGGALQRFSRVDPGLIALPAESVLAEGQAIPRFEDVAERAGIVMAHHADRSEGNPAIGTGAAWGDYDRDGRIDLYVTDHMGACHLYRNNGDGTFTDVAERAGVARPGSHATSAVFVDFDNDGWPDLYVGVAHAPNVLYRNNRDGTFTDVTRESGLGDPGRTMSTAWADYDGDGYLDVFVANYTDNAITFDPNSGPSENARVINHVIRPVSRLYHNNGDGTFSDVTHLLGDEATRGLGFSAVWFDYNNDGRPDLYVAYDFGGSLVPNVLWRNDGPAQSGGWSFTRVEDAAGVATEANPMGVASGDYNNDGWLDLAVSNIGPNFLYRNRAGQGFTDVAKRAGVTRADAVFNNMLNPSMTWGVSFADFNNDGWLDIYMVAGAMDFENVPQPNSLYLNNQRGGFINVASVSGTDDPGQGRSVAVADFDGDGSLDMFVANYGQPPILYRNLSRPYGSHWIRLELEGSRSNRDAVGARVTLHASGLPPQMREVQIGQGLGTCDDKAVHFGLAGASVVDRIDIRWPSGREQVLRNVTPDRVLRVREPTA